MSFWKKHATLHPNASDGNREPWTMYPPVFSNIARHGKSTICRCRELVEKGDIQPAMLDYQSVILYILMQPGKWWGSDQWPLDEKKREPKQYEAITTVYKSRMIEDALYVATIVLTRRKQLDNLSVAGWVTMMFSTCTLLSAQQKSCQKESALPFKPQNQQD